MSKKNIICITVAFIMTMTLLFGCGSSTRTYEDARNELKTMAEEVHATHTNPPMDVNMEEDSIALADINTFPITEQGSGDITIEIAAATEISAEKEPNNWINVMAQQFNKSGAQINGKSVNVSIRKITSGEVVTYITEGNYRPHVFIPSNEAWGMMLESSGFHVEKIQDRIAGNTAGILMSRNAYEEYQKKYGDVTVKNVLEAAIAGDILFAYTNPYTSSTGLNILSSMLHSYDNEDPLSEQAVSKLVEYQKNAPIAAYTTDVLSRSAQKGAIDTMVMEEQAYINTPDLKNFVYTPAGIRHDHPVYVFNYDTDEEKEAARMFTDFCLRDESQKLATECGFNRHDEYVGENQGLDGAGYLMAQKVWKTNKTGGRPVIAVFITDISGSMEGEPLLALKDSLISSMKYIGSDNYIGLVSYENNVYIDMDIDVFDAKQRANFSGAVKSLHAGGWTATYSAVMVGLEMMMEKMEEVPNARPMLFVLSDGEQNKGYSLERIKPIVSALGVPVYTIGYNMTSTSELEELAQLNEASLINANNENIVNQLRNLFNTSL